MRFCTGRTVDGVWIGAYESDAPALLDRAEQALALIREHDPRRYSAVKSHLQRIWITLLRGPIASYVAAASACQLDARYVRDPKVTIEDIATSIVHETSHARIDRYVEYREDLRYRIEAACRREELAFARRLPAGSAIVARTEQWLAAPPSEEWWSDAAFRDRRIDGSFENLRHLGVSQWVIALLRRFHVFMSTLRRILKGRWRSA